MGVTVFVEPIDELTHNVTVQFTNLHNKDDEIGYFEHTIHFCNSYPIIIRDTFTEIFKLLETSFDIPLVSRHIMRDSMFVYYRERYGMSLQRSMVL